MARVAIHQPNFIPWWPYFVKMSMADVFVILHRCQFEKGGYQNRFNHAGQWHTMRVYRGLDPINEKRYVDSLGDYEKISFDLIKEQLFVPFMKYYDYVGGESLLSVNYHIIKAMASDFDIHTKIVLEPETELVGTDRLVEICNRFDATEYISGHGAKEYLDESKFNDCGIRVKYTPVLPKDRQVTSLLALKSNYKDEL